MTNAMKTKRSALGAVAVVLLAIGVAPARGDDSVTIRKWKVDQVELCETAGGRVIRTQDTTNLGKIKAERAGAGWLKIQLDDGEYYIEASQVRTNGLKLEGVPKCVKLGAATTAAASRGYGENCE